MQTETSTEALRQPIPGEEPSAAPGPPRKRVRPAVLVLVGLLVTAGLGVGGYAYIHRGMENTDDAQVEADVVGLAPKIGGQVRNVLVRDNQPVRKGDLLVKIDDTEQIEKVKAAEADLAVAQANLRAAEAQEKVIAATVRGGLRSARASLRGTSISVTGADAQIAAARASLDRAQAESHKAETDLARARDLRNANAIPQERLDAAQAEYDIAHAAVEQANAMIATATQMRRAAESHVAEAEGRLAQSTPVDEQIAAAQAAADLAAAKVKAAEAALGISRLQLSYTNVTAPADGFVSKLTAREGQLLTVGQPFAELVPRDSYVVANFKETQIQGMHPGDRATVEIDAYPNRKLEAVVDSLAGGTGARFSMLPADNASGNFVKVVQRVPVRIRWLNLPSDISLPAGLSADVTVHVGKPAAGAQSAASSGEGTERAAK